MKSRSEYLRQWRARNPDSGKDACMDWRRAHPGYMKQKAAEWRRKHPGYVPPNRRRKVKPPPAVVVVQVKVQAPSRLPLQARRMLARGRPINMGHIQWSTGTRLEEYISDVVCGRGILEGQIAR